MSTIISGIILILFGIIYLWKPTVWRRGLWMKTSVAVRLLSETNYIRFMRALGVVMFFAGIVLVYLGWFDPKIS